jgi:hypothetical protein
VKRQTLAEVMALIALIAFGAQVRVYFQDLPNFAPVAALALFSGYFFRSWTMALCVPLGVMAISDAFIGAYDWRMMVLVYSMLALPVALRGPLRKYLNIGQGNLGRATGAVAGLVMCSLFTSLVFFFTTNFGSWLWFDMYPHNGTGLMTCYVQALPFFRFTLAGDLVFALALFGSYGLATQLGWARPYFANAGSL